MAFQISPGVNVSEIDLTTIVPAVSTTEGGIVGQFNWGPVNQRVLIDSEFTLVNTFRKPNNDSYEDFFTAASFLAYGNQLWVVRAAPSGGYNANADGDATTLVKNEDDYVENYEDAGISAAGHWTAKYPGKLGNSLKVSVCGDAAAWQSTLSGSVYVRSTLENDNTDLRKVVIGGQSVTTFSISDSANTANLTFVESAVPLSTLFAVGDSSTQGAYTNGMVVATGGGTAESWGSLYDLYVKTNASGNTIVELQISSAGSFVTSVPTPLVISGEFTNTVAIPGEPDSNFEVTLTGVSLNRGGTDFANESVVGDLLVLGTSKKMYRVDAIANSTYMTLDSVYDQTSGIVSSPTRRWEFYNYFDAAPGTSAFADNRGGSADELHVIVADEDGDWTGVKNEVIERFPNLSKAYDARTEDGATNYYKNRINNVSPYIWWSGHDTSLGASNLNDATTDFTITATLPITESLSGGADGTAPSDAARIDGYDEFRNAEAVDVSIVLSSSASAVVANYIINNVCEFRKDCVACISPLKTNVVENSSTPVSEQEDVIAFRNSLTSTSFAVMDSGWKYMYDRYNDVYRWVPLNGDIGGLMVRTDSVKDPWFSPAGYNRGTIKNVVKLAYNPEKSQRDQLYKNGINPVVSFPGQGVVLFGDKTLLTKPSAFDRINVRRLFIVLEKAISTAAQFALFEFNDSFTRAQFKNLIEPFLRDVKGRRGIYDFKVVCDETNNTPEVIDSNRFVGDIYIKPARSINFIQLNFVAVRTGVEFEEIVGRF